MQITEALLSELREIRRFVQQVVDRWPNLLAFHFTLHSVKHRGVDTTDLVGDKRWRTIPGGKVFSG
ncbi:hypothetical protein [Escherichia coli]